MRKTSVIFLVSLFALAGCSSSAGVSPSGTLPESPAYNTLSALPVACGGTAPNPPNRNQYDRPADLKLSTDKKVTATVTTSCGDLVLELDPALAPLGVNSFVFLAQENFFDGIVSHRIVPDFVLQIGDPTAIGGSGPGYSFADELPEDATAYTRGSVMMANSGPNTNGSQLFIAFTDLGERLPPTFTKLGEVVAGDDVLTKIEEIPTDEATEQPQEAFFIESITVSK